MISKDSSVNITNTNGTIIIIEINHNNCIQILRFYFNRELFSKTVLLYNTFVLPYIVSIIFVTYAREKQSF